MMDPNTNIASWMISGGLKSDAAAHNLEHVRALKASRPTAPGLASRLSAAVAALRPASTPVEPACCPA